MGNESNRVSDLSDHCRIVSAAYKLSVHKTKDLPDLVCPEVAFVGRSNVGKSSLLNGLCGRKNLARVAKTPGRTQAINFFNVDLRCSDSSREVYFADLPGYGYAKVAKSVSRNWKGLLEHYILERENLRAVVLLTDVRRELRDEEHWIADLGREGNLIVAVTKTDKVSRSEAAQKTKRIAKELSLSPQQVVGVSVLSGKQRGLEQILGLLWEILKDD